MRDSDAAKRGAAHRGFISAYATSALEEDKAEVFSFLMTEPAAVADMAKRDPVLKLKVLAVQKQFEAFAAVEDRSD